jgi:DNA-binding SARP family transcriptional activator
MVAYMTGQRYDEAIDKLSVYVEDHPQDCSGWDLYFQALLKKGLKSQAVEAYDRYKKCSGQ